MGLIYYELIRGEREGKRVIRDGGVVSWKRKEKRMVNDFRSQFLSLGRNECCPDNPTRPLRGHPLQMQRAHLERGEEGKRLGCGS